MGEALELWLGLGLDYSAFWAQTPHIAGRRIMSLQKRQYQTIVTQAWYHEYMARQKRLKSLSGYLKDTDVKKTLKKGQAMDAGPWLALMGAGSDLAKVSE